MMRLAIILACGVLVGAAAPLLPLPPTPPEDAPITEPAPVPNADAMLPDAGGSGTQFNLRMFSMREYGNGQAYIPGSAYQSPEERKAMQTPGFTVSVPMR